MKYQINIVALLAVLALSACTKNNGTTPTVNGYTVNGVAYKMDSMTLDASAAIHVWSSDHGGSSLTLQRLTAWPATDGIYEYLPIAATDTSGVVISFKHDSSSNVYQSGVSNGQIPFLYYTLDSGKRALQLSAHNLIGAQNLHLQITAKE
jgi:hypothetical protein